VSRRHRDQTRLFVLLFQGRTGSTYLTEALSSHPEINVLGEKFHNRSNRPGVQLQAMREFLTSPPFGNYRAKGFKTKLHDVGDPEGFAELLKKRSVYIIHFGRRNRVKHAVSWINAWRLYNVNGDWNLYKASERPAALTIDPAEFRTMLERIEERNRLLRDYVMSLELPTLSLYYEDLLVDERNTIDLVLSFLGVPSQPVGGKAIKNTSDNLRQVIKNFDELRSLYTGTPYETMFDEVILPEQMQR
jgi:LPS sulfotransferase NodH